MTATWQVIVSYVCFFLSGAFGGYGIGIARAGRLRRRPFGRMTDQEREELLTFYWRLP